MINEYEKEFNVNKEIIDALPHNNIKNRTKAISEIDNLLKKYLSDKDNVLEEINFRHQEYKNYEINPELENFNTTIQEMYKVLPFLNDVTTSYEKSELDRTIYNLDHFYNSSLDEANSNIFKAINIFEEVGIALEPKDFVYSIYTLTYITEVFNERQVGIDSVKLKNLFDSLYWKCPDIIKQITINFKYLYYKYKKYFDNYYQTKKNTIENKFQKSSPDIFGNFVNLKHQQYDLILKDKSLIMSRFINKIYDFKSYSKENISKSYKSILNENVSVNDMIDANIVKLNESLKEYKSYLDYKYIVDEIKKLYKEKDKYQKIALPKKKEIEKLEGKLISTSKNLNKMISKNKTNEKLVNLTNSVNVMITQVENLYKEYEENLFLERIALLSETTSIFDALKLAVSNYRFINKIIKNNDVSLTDADINRIISDINYYLYSNNLSIMKNIYITDERNIAMVIFDKYNLLGFNINADSLELGNIENLIETTTVLSNNICFDKLNINIDNIKFVFNTLDIVGKKD